jgi:cobalamin biosynthesis protein CobT
VKKFIECLPVLAGVLGNQLGVRVVMEPGGNPRTSGKTIYLPSLPWEDDTAEALTRYFLHHEAGHIRFTDFDHEKTGFGGLPPYPRSLANIVEDLRMERAHAKRYAGAEAIIAEGEKIDLEKAQDEGDSGLLSMPPEQDEPLAGLLQRLLYQEGGALVHDRATRKKNAQATAQAFDQAAGHEKAAKVHRLIETIPSLSNTTEAVQTALKILKVFADDQDDQPQPSPQPSDDVEQDGDQGQGSQTGENPSDNESGEEKNESQPSREASTSEDHERGEASDESQGSGAGGTSGDDESESDSCEAGDSHGEQAEDEKDASGQPGKASTLEQNTETGLQGTSDRLAEQIEDTADENPAASLGSSTDLTQLAKEAEKGAGSQYAHSVAGGEFDVREANSVSSALRGRMQGLLVAERQRRRGSETEGRRLKANKLHGYWRPRPRLYRAPREVAEPDTLVWTLIDRSGSMREDVNRAQQYAWAIAHSLEGVGGIKTGVSLFPGVTRTSQALKYPGQSLRSSLGNWGVGANGGTPLGQAMFETAMRMLAFGENRKILLVITDGAPHDPALVEEMVRRLEGFNTELAGLMLGGSAERLKQSGFTDTQEVATITDLPGAMTQLLTKKLLKRKAA